MRDVDAALAGPARRLWATAAMLIAACQAPSPARYLASERPLEVPDLFPAVCVAIDPSDPRGVWWWGPVGGDCSRRSTGPGVFPADEAFVSRDETGAVRAGLRLQLILPPDSDAPVFVDVRIVLERDMMHVIGTNVRVPIRARADLDVEEGW